MHVGGVHDDDEILHHSVLALTSYAQRTDHGWQEGGQQDVSTHGLDHAEARSLGGSPPLLSPHDTLKGANAASSQLPESSGGGDGSGAAGGGAGGPMDTLAGAARAIAAGVGGIVGGHGGSGGPAGGHDGGGKGMRLPAAESSGNDGAAMATGGQGVNDRAFYRHGANRSFYESNSI